MNDMLSNNQALAELAARVRHDLACTDYPQRLWVRSRPGVYDVVVVGAGQSGLATGFALMREHIDNILLLDENPQGQEGPWITYARMVTLRTPKYVTSVDLGVPSLTFRAWWEAQHGAEGWEALGKIPREEWMCYLAWYRETLQLPVRNDTRVTLVENIEPGLFRVHTTTGEVLARKVVLATGIQGGGEWHTPDFIKAALPPSLYAHTSQAVDYVALAGKKIAVLGGGASAFDNAQYALGAGVAQAHVFIRKPELPRVNPIRFMENAGFLGHFADLDDATKYDVITHFLALNQPPTNDTFDRAAAYPGFALHTGEPWDAVRVVDDGIEIITPKSRYIFDFLVLSTGLLTDPALRPELATLAPDIACWRDRFTAAQPKALIDAHPYLAPDFSFTGKTPDGAARLHGLFNFNYAALPSLGLSASALSGMKFAVPKLVRGIARQLFSDDAKAIVADYKSYAEVEFLGGS